MTKNINILTATGYVLLAIVLYILLGQYNQTQQLRQELAKNRRERKVDSLSLARYKSYEQALFKTLQTYDTNKLFLHIPQDLTFYIDTLFRTYMKQNRKLDKQLQEQKEALRLSTNSLIISNLQRDTLNQHLKVMQFNTAKQSLTLTYQQHQLDSLATILAKTKADLAEVGIDTLVMTSPRGNKIYFYGKTTMQKPAGFGIGFYEKMGYYIGEWLYNARHGFGKHVFKDGSYYEGYFENDERNGYGTYYYPTGEIFKGNWKNGLMNGTGEIIDKDGKRLKGVWKEGKITKKL